MPEESGLNQKRTVNRKLPALNENREMDGMQENPGSRPLDGRLGDDDNSCLPLDWASKKCIVSWERSPLGINQYALRYPVRQAEMAARQVGRAGKRLNWRVRRGIFQIALTTAPRSWFRNGIVLFDLDDTLLDHNRAFVRFSRQLYNSSVVMHQTHTEEDAVNRMISFNAGGRFPKVDVFDDVLREWPGVFNDSDEAMQVYLHSLPCNLALDASTRALLENLKDRGIACAIVTNGSTNLQMEKVMASGLDSLVQTIVISARLGIRKPDRRIFIQALAAMRADPTTTLFVGDDPNADILGAKAVGMRTVWLSHGRQWSHADNRPDHIVGHVSEVGNIVFQRDK